MPCDQMHLSAMIPCYLECPIRPSPTPRKTFACADKLDGIDVSDAHGVGIAYGHGLHTLDDLFPFPLAISGSATYSSSLSGSSSDSEGSKAGGGVGGCRSRCASLDTGLGTFWSLSHCTVNGLSVSKYRTTQQQTNKGRRSPATVGGREEARRIYATMPTNAYSSAVGVYTQGTFINATGSYQTNGDRWP